MKEHYPSDQLSTIALLALMREPTRKLLADDRNIPWKAIWEAKLAPVDSRRIVDMLESELGGHLGGMRDHDIAFAAVLTRSLLANKHGALDAETTVLAKRTLAAVAQRYPSINVLPIDFDAFPNVTPINAEIDAAPVPESPEDDIPF